MVKKGEVSDAEKAAYKDLVEFVASEGLLFINDTSDSQLLTTFD